MQTGEVKAESTPTPRQRRASRAVELTDAFRAARRVDDQAAARLLAEHLDNNFVAGAYLRCWDPEIKRLRRLLREAS